MKSKKLNNNRGGVKMKTLTKMFLLSCWCLLSVSFAKETLDEIKANQEQQLIQQKLEVLNQQNNQVKEKISIPESEEAGCEEEISSPILINQNELKQIPVPNYSNDGQDKEAFYNSSLEAKEAGCEEEVSSPLLINQNELKQIVVPNYTNDGQDKEAFYNNLNTTNEADLKIVEVENSDSDIINEFEKEMLEKGFATVQEYLDYLAANEAALTKEGAVSFETYLQGLDAKEQATILEYVLQSSSNEGVVRDNNKLPHFKGFSPDRNPMNQEKVEYYENLKANPQGNPYSPTRECVDTDDGSTGDPWGDMCADYYESWCGNYDDDDFFSMEMCCICGGGEETGGGDDEGCPEGSSEYTWACGGGSYGSEVSWELNGADGTVASGSVGEGTVCLADGDYSVTGYDSYGDTWNGNLWTLTDADGNLLWTWGLSYDNSDGSVGTSDTFTLGGTPPVSGCTDATAPEYDPAAETDDGSCWANCAGNVGWIGDGYCDGSNNNEGCAYDGGDCCESTCTDGSYSCDSYGGCNGDCLDPNGNDDNCAEPTCADTDCGYWITNGYTCEDLTGWGYDCSLCEAEDACPAPQSCEDQGLVDCGDGECWRWRW